MHLRGNIATIHIPIKFAVCNLSNNKSFNGPGVTQGPSVTSEMVNCNEVNDNAFIMYQDISCLQLAGIQP